MLKLSQKLSTQSVALASSRAGGQLVMVLVLAAVARTVGIERVGLMASAVAIGTVGAGIIDFGSGSLWVRELSAGRLSQAEFRRRTGSKLTLGVTISGILLAVAFTFDLFAGLWGAGFVLFSAVISQAMQASLVASKRISSLIIVALVERVVFGGFFVLFRTLKVDAETAYYISYLLGALSLALIAWVTLSHEMRPAFRGPTGGSFWKGSLFYGLSSSLIAVQGVDIVIGGAVGGAGVAGAYGAVSRWTMPVTLATSSFSTLLAPVVAGASNAHEVWVRVRRSLWIPVASVAMACVMVVAAEPLVLWAMGEEFLLSVPVLQWLALSAALSACAQTLMTVLQARRRERFVARAIFVSVVLRLLLVVPLVLLWSSRGLAIGAAVAQLVLLLFLSVAVYRAWSSSKRVMQINASNSSDSGTSFPKESSNC